MKSLFVRILLLSLVLPQTSAFADLSAADQIRLAGGGNSNSEAGLLILLGARALGVGSTPSPKGQEVRQSDNDASPVGYCLDESEGGYCSSESSDDGGTCGFDSNGHPVYSGGAAQ